MTQKLIFDTLEYKQAYDALAHAANKAAKCAASNGDTCVDCVPATCGKGCADWCQGTTQWDEDITRLTDGKYIVNPCPDMDNSSYNQEEDATNWYE